MTTLLLKLFIKDYKNTSDPKVRDKYGTLGSFFGILCNLLLFAVKITLGILSGAVSIIADALNNLTDIGSSVVTLLGFKLAKKPADPDHPFGHGRIEYISAFVVAVIILLVGFELLKSSFEKIFNPTDLKISIWITVGLIISIIAKFLMALFLKKLARSIDSPSLKASSSDCFNDSVATFFVLASVLVFRFLGVNIDPYVGLLVALFIIYSGINTAKETISPLLGEPPSAQLISDIKKAIFKYDDFTGMHDLIVHNYGVGRTFASVHVEVPENIDIVYCHELIDACELEIKNSLGIEIVIHMDPIAIHNEAIMKLSQEISEKIREIDSRLTIHDFRIVEGENQTNLIFDTVLPPDFKMSAKEIKKLINNKAKEIDPKFVCVVELDIDYSGK